MNKVIIVKNEDGSCAIVHPAPVLFDPTSRDRLELAEKATLSLNATEDEVLEFIISKSNLGGKEYRIADRAILPADRTFRNAWTDDNATETVDVDINKAKEIKKDELRELRKPLLEALDLDFMKALEQGEATAEIVAAKQELRDVTKLALPDDVEELKAFMPDILKE